jgi:aldehyde:ferredoxin oxidoreductase
VRNYTTTIFPEADRFTGEWLRTHFETKLQPCWACRFNHCHLMKVTEGPYTGFEGEEPDYEPTAAMSSAIGQTDPGACIMLANLVDNLGIDANEVGWLVGLVMECYEKGLLSKDNLDGLEMNWGNAEATAELLKRTAKRKGIGDLLAEGTKRVAEHIGGEALKMGVYTLKGGTPRGSDHRGKWYELIDTCVSNTSTTESTARHPQWEQVGLPPLGIDEYDPITVTNQLAKFNGRRQFDDSLGVCGFCINSFQLTIDALNAITGWDFDISEAMQQGLRAVNLLRLFSFRHGLTKEMEAPSIRLGSAPADGPHKGISVMPHWDTIRRNYYQQMGWDPDTGKPLLGTLQKLGLGHLVE